MAFNAYLKLLGINGEATSPGYDKWITIDSWSWGASRPGVGGRLSTQSFSFTAHAGAHTAPLLTLLAEQKVVKTGMLTVTKSGEKGLPAVQQKWEFTDIALEAYEIGESLLLDEGPEEQVSFEFTALTLITGSNEVVIRVEPPG